MSDYQYENLRRLQYGCDDEYGRATFVPVCSKCFKFVKADATVALNEHGLKDGPNATCRRCGRVEMLFEGFF